MTLPQPFNSAWSTYAIMLVFHSISVHFSLSHLQDALRPHQECALDQALQECGSLSSAKVLLVMWLQPDLRLLLLLMQSGSSVFLYGTDPVFSAELVGARDDLQQRLRYKGMLVNRQITYTVVDALKSPSQAVLCLLRSGPTDETSG